MRSFHQRDDRVDFGVGERRDERLGRAAGDGVDLHQLQLAAGGGDFVEPVAERFELRRRRRLACHAHEERLGSPAAGRGRRP